MLHARGRFRYIKGHIGKRKPSVIAHFSIAASASKIGAWPFSASHYIRKRFAQYSTTDSYRPTMPESSHTVDQVYGVVRDIPLNYVSRDNVDFKLVENLTHEKHIVIYGSSKQGKTCLRKECVGKNEQILVQCSNKWSLEDIHSNILKRAGFEITLSEKKSVTGRNKIIASIGAMIPGMKSKVGTEMEASNTEETTTKKLELDPSDTNDIIAALRSIDFDKYIVLEDFHYLPVDTQKDFSVALKAFHEVSDLCFIVVGVWLEENRLIVYNGDLTGRVVAVNADEWSRDQLLEVINDGAALINVQFDDDFKDELIELSYNSVYIVQEVCRKACIEEGIESTQDEPQTVGARADVRSLVKNVVDQQTGRYVSFITQFAGGFQETRLEMYKWLLYPILKASSEKLENGFSYSDLRKALRANHPVGEDLNIGNLTQSLQSTASLQVTKGIKPIILDYDQTDRYLSIVDRGFVIWSAHQNTDELLEMAGFSTGSGSCDL